MEVFHSILHRNFIRKNDMEDPPTFDDEESIARAKRKEAKIHQDHETDKEHKHKAEEEKEHVSIKLSSYMMLETVSSLCSFSDQISTFFAKDACNFFPFFLLFLLVIGWSRILPIHHKVLLQRSSRSSLGI